MQASLTASVGATQLSQIAQTILRQELSRGSDKHVRATRYVEILRCKTESRPGTENGLYAVECFSSMRILTMNSAIIGRTRCTSAHTVMSCVKMAGTALLAAKATTPTARPTAAPICSMRSKTARACCRFLCSNHTANQQLLTPPKAFAVNRSSHAMTYSPPVAV